MKRMNSIILIISSLLILLACNGLVLTPTTTISPTTSASEPSVNEATATEALAAIPTPTEPATETYIAYVQNDTLKVTHVIGGQVLDTQQYAVSQLRGGLYNVGWSPSGEFLTFSMYVNSFAHLFIVNVADGSEPIDLGIANDWAWSADSKLLAFEHEYEVWVFSTESGQSRGLTIHLGADWLWFTPAFTPSGDALVAAGMPSDHMDRNGGTLFKIYQIPLDGSAASDYPPGKLTPITEQISGPRPSSLHFSPDGSKLVIAGTIYGDSCANESSYWLSNADGSDLHKLQVASLTGLDHMEDKIFFMGDSFVWDPQSDGLWVNAMVRDCKKINGIVAGPQISHVTLDGQEMVIIPGTYDHLSLDHTGTLLGVVNRLIPSPHVQILGLDGHLVLDLGEGDYAALKP